MPDPADRATIEEEHALELRTRDRERKLLKKIGAVAGAHRSRRLWLLRRDRRADRPGAPAGAADGHAVARGAAAPRAEAEDVRRLNASACRASADRPPDGRDQGRRELLSQGGALRGQPGHRWADLAPSQDDTRELDLEKSELKAMIERKRRNDFVRKREFDMLRKVRREGLSPEQLAALGGSSRLDDSEAR